MHHLVVAKINSVVSIASIIVAWVIAQLPTFEFTSDEILTITVLGIAVGTIWRAFLAKDKSETKILKEQLKEKNDHIEVLTRAVKQLEDHVDTLKNGK